MSVSNRSTVEGLVLEVTKRVAMSGAWAHGVVIGDCTYSMYTDDEFFPVQEGDHVRFSYVIKSLQSKRRVKYYVILPNTLQIHVSSPDHETATGFVYVLTNRSMPGLVKIGVTERTPEARARELSKSTSVPSPFMVECSIPIHGDASRIEKACHAALASKRKGKEFFAVSIIEAKECIERIYSDIYPDRAIPHKCDSSERPKEFQHYRKVSLANTCATREHEVEQPHIHAYKKSEDHKDQLESEWKQHGYVIVVARDFIEPPTDALYDADGNICGHSDNRTYLQRFFNINHGPGWLDIKVAGRMNCAPQRQPPWRVIFGGYSRGRWIEYVTRNGRYTFLEAMKDVEQLVDEFGISNFRVVVEAPTNLLDNPALLEGESLKYLHGRLYITRCDLDSISIRDACGQ